MDQNGSYGLIDCDNFSNNHYKGSQTYQQSNFVGCTYIPSGKQSWQCRSSTVTYEGLLPWRRPPTFEEVGTLKIGRFTHENLGYLGGFWVVYSMVVTFQSSCPLFCPVLRDSLGILSFCSYLFHAFCSVDDRTISRIRGYSGLCWLRLPPSNIFPQAQNSSFPAASCWKNPFQPTLITICHPILCNIIYQNSWFRTSFKATIWKIQTSIFYQDLAQTFTNRHNRPAAKPLTKFCGSNWR